jgi:transcriptional regulator of acetoin/glycerol metabolism
MSETTERSQARAPRRINDALLRHLWPSRLPDKELAHRLGHDRSTLYRRARKIGLPNRRTLWAKDTP